MTRILNKLTDWDILFYYFINNRSQHKYIIKTLMGISITADGYFYYLVPLFFLVYNPAIGIPLFINLLIAFFILMPLYLIIKNTVCRERPFENFNETKTLVDPPDKFSFPSGHTAAAFLFCIIISSFFPVAIYLLIPWAILVGMSRVFLGMHYLTDIIAGSILGTISALSSMYLYEPISQYLSI
mgnify:CR=1 FL=1